MALDVPGIAARLKRVTSTAVPPMPPAPVERPWLTAEAVMPSIAGHSPAVDSNTPDVAGPPPAAPPRRTGGRGPKWRRWTGRAERRQELAGQPPPLPFAGGGLSAYGHTLDSADNPYSGLAARPRPLGRGPADTSSLVRDSASAMRGAVGSRSSPSRHGPHTGPFGNAPPTSGTGTSRPDRPHPLFQRD
jgi:hypothetical protein